MMQKSELLKSTKVSNGSTLHDVFDSGPVLLVFLRHFGCVFCREALHDLATKTDDLSQSKIKLILVHMADQETAEKYFIDYGLPSDVLHISDPECNLYKAYGLAKGGVSELLGLKNLIRGFEVTLSGTAKPSMKFIGDGFQMPGLFLVNKGEIINKFIHVSAADRPDYDAIIAVVKS